jgi:hypothetical protein
VANNLCHWAHSRLGLRRAITESLRQWQRAEPLVWLLVAGFAGAWLGRTGDTVRRRRI